MLWCAGTAARWKTTVLRVVIGLCLGIVIGWFTFSVRPAANARQAAPANVLVDQWRPGLLFGEVEERAAREGMRLGQRHREGGAVVHRLENAGAGTLGLGFCGDRLLFVRHVLTLASALQAMEYVSLVVGPRQEAVVGMEFDPDKTGNNSGPRGELTLAWQAHGAAREIKLLNLGSERMLLVETLSASDQACLP